MPVIHFCECGRIASSVYASVHWCCIYCRRGGGHTHFCDKRQPGAKG